MHQNMQMPHLGATYQNNRDLMHSQFMQSQQRMQVNPQGLHQQ